MDLTYADGVAADAVGARPSTASRLGRVAAILSLLLGAATVVLHLVNGPEGFTSWWFGTATIALTSGAMGWLLTDRRPANPIGWLFCTAGVAAGLCGTGREYLVLSVTGHSLPAALFVGVAADSLFIVSIATLPTVLMLFPDGHPLPGRFWRYVLVAVPLAAACAWAASVFSPGTLRIAGRSFVDPVGATLPESVRGVVDLVANAGFPVVALAALISVGLRYRRSGVRTRRQIAWVALAGAVALVETALEISPLYWIGPVAGPLADSLFIAAIAVAIVRHQLLDIELVINRTLVYVAVSVLLIAGYLAVVTVVAQVGSGGPLLGTALVALAFAPLRVRMQRGVDRLMYGERDDPYGVMSSLNRQLERGDSAGTELGIVLDVVTGSLKLPYAAIRDPAGALIAEADRPRGTVSERTLTYRGEPMGLLQVCPRSGSALGAADERVLTDLARQTGALLHAVRLAADLQESRRRMVTAKEEERRRLRRDLHDGLGPELAALTLKIDGASLQLTSRPERAGELLADVRAGLTGTIEDIRRLVYDLRPPALDELGLLGALRDFVRRLDTADGAQPRVTVEAPERWTALPAAVEVAAYRIATEAVTNVVRHARARSCVLRLTFTPSCLRLEVTDDGDGLPERPVPGVGTRSIVERAAEIGGTATVQNRTDEPGTVVRAELPLSEVPA